MLAQRTSIRRCHVDRISSTVLLFLRSIRFLLLTNRFVNVIVKLIGIVVVGNFFVGICHCRCFGLLVFGCGLGGWMSSSIILSGLTASRNVFALLDKTCETGKTSMSWFKWKNNQISFKNTYCNAKVWSLDPPPGRIVHTKFLIWFDPFYPPKIQRSKDPKFWYSYRSAGWFRFPS